MPIYEYRCSECGCEKEYLQKVSDPLKTQCPECGKATLQKKVTAAGFQLKGSGWYVTDFRDGGKKADAKPASTVASSPSKDKSASADSASASSSAGTSASAASGDSKKSDSSSSASAGKSDAGSTAPKSSTTTSGTSSSGS